MASVNMCMSSLHLFANLSIFFAGWSRRVSEYIYVELTFGTKIDSRDHDDDVLHVFLKVYTPWKSVRLDRMESRAKLHIRISG
jgi:hypothetical protein